jgi:hypothetical protein
MPINIYKAFEMNARAEREKEIGLDECQRGLLFIHVSASYEGVEICQVRGASFAEEFMKKKK